MTEFRNGMKVRIFMPYFACNGAEGIIVSQEPTPYTQSWMVSLDEVSRQMIRDRGGDAELALWFTKDQMISLEPQITIIQSDIDESVLDWLEGKCT
jgi:hypothetical protein